MLWFDNWYKDTKQNSSQATGGLKDHWKQFISELHIIPKTMCQDDVENYFSLQSARVSGGKPTTLQFFESSASLETELLLSSEMKDLQGTCGSYDLTALPNLVSPPLSKPKLTSRENTKHFTEKEGWELCAGLLASDSIIEETWEFNQDFHDAADKLQLSRHVKQTVECMDLFSPTTILQTSQPILTAHAKENHQHVPLFARRLDSYLRTNLFTGNWSSISL